MASTSRWAGAPKRLANFAGCEVGTSQGAKLRHRRVRNVGAALGVFSSRCRVDTNKWQCRNCGAIIEAESAPEKCPVCDHPKAYFQLEQANF